MRLWKIFLIIGVVLSAIGCVLLPVSQIRTEIQVEEPMPYRVFWTDAAEEPVSGVICYTVQLYDVYPYSWLLLPATIIVTAGIVSIIYSYLVKRTYG